MATKWLTFDATSQIAEAYDDEADILYPEDNFISERIVTEVTQISAAMKNVDTKEVVADIGFSLAYGSNGLPEHRIEYNTTVERRRLLEENAEFPDVVNGIAIDDELNCTLVLTEYGDMSSFVGH